MFNSKELEETFNKTEDILKKRQNEQEDINNLTKSEQKAILISKFKTANEFLNENEIKSYTIKKAGKK